MEKLHKNNEIRSDKVHWVKRKYQLQSKEHMPQTERKNSKLNYNVTIGSRNVKNFRQSIVFEKVAKKFYRDRKTNNYNIENTNWNRNLLE